MGNFFSILGQIVVSAVHEFIVSVVDITVFVLLLLALTIAAWFLAFFIRVVFKLVFGACRPNVPSFGQHV
ncbi:E protein [Lopma virus]|nr:E protein [Lopma virus]